MRIQERVAAAARTSGRKPRDVWILPVSETRPIPMVQAAMAAGVREFGESRPQDLAARAQELGANLRRSGSGNTGVLTGLGGISTQLGVEGRDTDLGLAPCESGTKPDMSRWVMIGDLQRSKAKLAVTYAAELQSLDSLRLAGTLSRLLGEAGRELDVMVRVNVSGETVKREVESGVALDFTEQVAALPGLRLVGLVGVAAPLSVVGEAGIHEMFARLRAIRDMAVVPTPETSGLSMGMNGDFEIAIAEGSTCVRLGSGLLGQRRAGVVAPADK